MNLSRSILTVCRRNYKRYTRRGIELEVKNQTQYLPTKIEKDSWKKQNVEPEVAMCYTLCTTKKTDWTVREIGS